MFYESEASTNSWESGFQKFSIPFKFEELINYVNNRYLENLIAVHATSSSTFAKHYIKLLENGCNIVAANKVANTIENNYYKTLRNTLEKHNKQFLYETNVGTGLPIYSIN